MPYACGCHQGVCSRRERQPGIQVVIRMDFYRLLIGSIAGSFIFTSLLPANGPEIVDVSPRPAHTGEKVVIAGRNFGDDDGNGALWLGRCPSERGAPGGGTVHLPRRDIESWNNEQITFILPTWASGSLMVQPSRGPVSETATFEVADACQPRVKLIPGRNRVAP